MTKDKQQPGMLLATFVAMNGRNKWETLVLNGLIGTDEPWIPAMTETLRDEADKSQSLLVENERKDRVIAEMSDAIDLADNHIAIVCGTDTPKAWDRAVRRVQEARTLLGDS